MGRCSSTFPTGVCRGNWAWDSTRHGKLLNFRAVPPLMPDAQLEAREPEWAKWFTEEDLGFDLGRLEKTSDKTLRPPELYDHLQVWRGVGPQTNEFYVEAAAYSGRPVYFEVLEPLALRRRWPRRR